MLAFFFWNKPESNHTTRDWKKRFINVKSWILDHKLFLLLVVVLNLQPGAQTLSVYHMQVHMNINDIDFAYLRLFGSCRP